MIITTTIVSLKMEAVGMLNAYFVNFSKIITQRVKVSKMHKPKISIYKVYKTR